MRTDDDTTTPAGGATRVLKLRSLRRRFTERWVAGIVVGFALVVAGWFSTRQGLLHAREQVDGSDEAHHVLDGLLESNDIVNAVAILVLVALALFFFRPLDKTLRDEGDWLEATEAERAEASARRAFDVELHEGLEMASDEPAIARLVSHVLDTVLPDNPSELLLADSSDAHLTTWAVHPTAKAAGCGVAAPFECPAVKRAKAQTFPSSGAINACPYLRDRPGGACSAHCVPVTFMGRALGVLHVTGPHGEPVDSNTGERIGTLADKVGTHIGTVRAFAKAQLQASTDGLTGLPNRRTAEDELGRRLTNGRPLAVAIADLDHFKQLNDTFGHEAGDRALRMFADTIRRALRAEDIFGRWGGEEFVIGLPNLDKHDAEDVLQRARRALAEACASADTAPVTASFGLVDTGDGARVDELVRLADDALRVAKRSGRDQVCVGPVLDVDFDVDGFADEVLLVD